MRNLYRQPYTRGSNQYRAQRQTRFIRGGTWLSILAVLLFFAIPIAICWFMAQNDRQLDALNRALTVNVYAAEKIETIDTETDEQKEIADYIWEVFGDDAPKAFAVLKCENARLNPDAVNTAGNEPAGSRDIGVFQINEYWQKVNGKFLFNWKINVQIAHQIFVDNGHSFERWTCGRKLGI